MSKQNIKLEEALKYCFENLIRIYNCNDQYASDVAFLTLLTVQELKLIEIDYTPTFIIKVGKPYKIPKGELK